jgi:DNA topoisomerase-1
LPGQDLLQYIGEDGEIRAITSSDVNEYLRNISGLAISAKDFRTWAGAVLAAAALGECAGFASAAEAKRNINAAVQKVAARLGNTPTICRKCYIHPEFLSGYVEGDLAGTLAVDAQEICSDFQDLPAREAAVMAYLASRDVRAAGSSPAT